MKPVVVKCVRGRGDREADEISNSLIVSDSMAVAVGKRFLDDPDKGGYYQTKSRSFKVPHKSKKVVPGVWVEVSNGDLNLAETPVRVKNYQIDITPNNISAIMESQEFVDVEI